MTKYTIANIVWENSFTGEKLPKSMEITANKHKNLLDFINEVYVKNTTLPDEKARAVSFELVKEESAGNWQSGKFHVLTWHPTNAAA